MTNVAAVVIAGIIPELQSHSFLNHVNKTEISVVLFGVMQSMSLSLIVKLN